MKVRPDTKTGSVLVVLTAKEAATFAQKLFGSALQSGAPMETSEEREVSGESEERER